MPDTRLACEVRPAVNHGARRGTDRADMIILHYTGMPSAEGALEWLVSEESNVSSHYFIWPDGDIVQLVPEARRAWHAGASSWRDDTDINSRSIGIEIANSGHEHDFEDFPSDQISSVIALCKDIGARLSIPARHILAHSDIAPSRKIDPGEKFPWDKLAAEGVGLWVPPADVAPDTVFGPGDNSEEIASMQALLALYGYGVGITGTFDHETGLCVAAFQRRFRPQAVTGHADRQTLATLEDLIAELQRQQTS